MGADIRTEGRVAVVCGVERLHGAEVVATDLRGGAALVTAGLAAEGITTVQGVAHTLQRKTDSKAAKESERWQGVNGTTTSGVEGA